METSCFFGECFFVFFQSRPIHLPEKFLFFLLYFFIRLKSQKSENLLLSFGCYYEFLPQYGVFSMKKTVLKREQLFTWLFSLFPCFCFWFFSKTQLLVSDALFKKICFLEWIPPKLFQCFFLFSILLHVFAKFFLLFCVLNTSHSRFQKWS